MSGQEAFEEFAVVRDLQMKKLVYNHILPELRAFLEQLVAETDRAPGRT